MAEVRAAEDGGTMAPWDQHSAVISIPRFDYAAPASLLERSHAGFLITCPIKREKSATKEAMTIFEKHASLLLSYGSEGDESHRCVKKRRLSSSGSNGDQVLKQNSTVDNLDESTGELGKPENEENGNSSFNLSLVKLTKSGLLLFMFPSNDFRHSVLTLTTIFKSLKSGDLKPPLWCHRIFPIQETCILTEKCLKIAVSKVMQEYFCIVQDKHDEPCKFAVGYNRRGIEENKMTNKKTGDFKELTLLDRDECFRVVAQAVKEVVKNSVVDLKSPELAVLIEVLPISGAPDGSVVAGVSVLPSDLITTKPSLCIRSLVSDTKVANKKD